MFEGLLGRKFSSKCKSSIKSTMARIEMVRKRRKATQNFLTNDIGHILRRGLDTNAYSKAEGLCAELNQISCYDFIDQFCGCILDHLSAMQKERECPKECREAVSSLIFAAARMADVPELRELRNILTERYGNSLESFVNKEFAEKLKSKSSSKDMKLQLLRDIAQESSIEWDSKALEQKLFNPPASDQDQKKKISPKTEDVARKEDEVDPSSNGKGDDVDDGYRLNISRRSAVPGKDNQGFLSHETPSFAPREDNGGHQKFSSLERRVPEKEMDDRRPYPRRVALPPYTRPKPEKNPTGSEALPGGSGGEEVDNKPERTPTGTNSPGQGEVAEKLNAQVIEGEAKPKPRSVRRRQLNPPPGHDQGDESVKTNPRRTRLEDPRRGLQILNAGDHDQKDEKELDRLLIHYSTKKPSQEPPPPPSHQTAAENSESTGNRSPDHKHRPSRVRSLPIEPTTPTEETRKGHVRATSFQPDMMKFSHVHPKLPDYDEVAARLAALRGK